MTIGALAFVTRLQATQVIFVQTGTMRNPLIYLLLSSAAVCATAFGLEASANTAIVIKDIKIDGLRHLEPGSLLPSLPLKKGDALTAETASRCLRAIYGTGLIADATMRLDGETVVFHVAERPTIAELDFSGLHEFEKSKLLDMFHDIGVKSGQPLDKALLAKSMDSLKRLYLGRGFQGVEVQTTTTPIDGDRVSILISIREGPVAKIRQIAFIGNERFSDPTLRNVISLRPSDWSSWHTKNDVYVKETLELDVERLSQFYQERGYIDFSISSIQPSITPDGTCAL